MSKFIVSNPSVSYLQLPWRNRPIYAQLIICHILSSCLDIYILSIMNFIFRARRSMKEAHICEELKEDKWAFQNEKLGFQQLMFF